MPLLSSLSHTHEPKAERTEGGKREKGSHIRNRIRSSGSDTDVGGGWDQPSKRHVEARETRAANEGSSKAKGRDDDVDVDRR